MAEKVEIILDFVKETKNYLRYQEGSPDQAPVFVSDPYLRKTLFGNTQPAQVKVTLEWTD